MNNRSLFIVIVLTLVTAAGCKKNAGDPTPDHTAGIIPATHWSGTESFSFSISYSVPGRIISDTSFSIKKISNSEICVANNIFLIYRATDSTAQTIKFDSVAHAPAMGYYGTWTHVTYFYAVDSIVFESYVASPLPGFSYDDYQAADIVLHATK